MYKYTSRSLSDPNGENGGLGYKTKEEADYHTKIMNELRLNFDDTWNKDFWKKQPERWETFCND